MTVSLEVSGAEASREYVQAADAQHPSLVDPGHRVDALFGVVNIPNVVWIDEQGTVVRPAEPGWPGGGTALPMDRFAALPATGRAPNAPPPPAQDVDPRALLAPARERRQGYPDAVRDWVEKGSASEYALSPEQVVARSQPRDQAVSEAAAHFALAEHLWRAGERGPAIEHFNHSHRLAPGNWTYKRQAWSLVGNERVGGPAGRWVQGPVLGEEDDWPFDSDFRSDIALLREGEYYPQTL